MVKNINGDIYSDLITSARPEIYGTNGTVGVSANLVVKPADDNITAIEEVCKQKLRETVG